MVFALTGVRVGGLFDLAAIRLVARVAAVTLGFVLALMAACGLLGWCLATATGIDPLTAYLATTPGGIESVTIAALDTVADTSLVLTIQMIRFLVIVLLGPPLVLRLTRRRRHRQVVVQEVAT